MPPFSVRRKEKLGILFARFRCGCLRNKVIVVNKILVSLVCKGNSEIFSEASIFFTYYHYKYPCLSNSTCSWISKKNFKDFCFFLLYLVLNI